MARRPIKSGYTADEVVLGVGVAVALHILPGVVLLARASANPSASDRPPVEKPVIAASLLKLGKPLDPSKLPDRLVPEKATTKRQENVASREDPAVKKPDAGVPSKPNPDAEDSDLESLKKKSDPFAESTAKKAELGSEHGTKMGLETDESRVRAGDLYAAELNRFFHERWAVPTVIPKEEADTLCVAYRFTVGQNMAIWQMSEKPVKGSGNELFDDSARTMLQKLIDSRTPLPDPPEAVAELYRGRTVQTSFTVRGGVTCR